MRCSVAMCGSDNKSEGFDKQIMFFPFPTNPKLLQIWVNACRRINKFSPNYARICSKHFTEDSYVRDLKFELTGYLTKKRRLLKDNAVPTLNLPTIKKPLILRRQNVVEILENVHPLSSVPLSSSSNSNADSRSIENSDPVIIQSCTCQNDPVFPRYKEIGTNTDFDDRDNTIKKLKTDILKLQWENQAFRKLFSSTQIRKLKNPGRKVVWSSEDISKGIMIHSTSPEAYNLLLDRGYPFPAPSTLRRWCSKIKESNP